MSKRLIDMDRDELVALIDERLERAIKREPEPVELIGADEFCAMTGYAPTTVSYVVKKYKIPHHRLGPGAPYRFKRDELIAWLEGHKSARGPRAA